jgi:diketogulonate reductase-like aldo/keto reductase
MKTLTPRDRAPLANNTTSIPTLGFGVYQLYGQSCQKAILAALEAGYRHIDSAQLYQNELDVGAAIQQSPLRREDVFLTTKIRQSAGSPEKSYQSCAASIDKVGGKGGYVDLFLIHIPGSARETREELWSALERLYKEGRARAIGVSNYRPQHIEEMREYAKVWPPHVNQIEVCCVPGARCCVIEGQSKSNCVATSMVSATRNSPILSG